MPTDDPEHPHVGRPQRAFGGPGRNGLGMTRGHRRGVADDVFASSADRPGVADWAWRAGWTRVEATGPRYGVAQELVRSAPVRRIDADHRPRDVIAGSAGDLDLLAFDIAVRARTGAIPEWAVTAVPLPDGAPAVRVSPARLWSHGAQELTQAATGDDALDRRWRILGDDDRVAQLAGDPALQQALLATDDGDDIWTAAGHVAALRPDGHRPQLLEHHARLLAVVHRALTRYAG
ncbi:hypothetical protein [Modestobacter roseus]|uniref:Uncharacterized protein n=1 Tax=Modestobacter roseus TaxID=1181884 RepID=A0A562IPJ2_9ACTN|nr:hypothetical protein [Modestobacter roseus]MQA35772.1 hypothetical protein [Modestobacter roseus]TWH72800.1 hypothetical protein JD78_01322 [Modestobacter roseus]